MATNDAAASGPTDAPPGPQYTLGSFIRMQRQLAHLSLRELAAMTTVSNAYLSQVERDLHQPSLKVLRSIAEALGIPVAHLFSQAGAGTDSMSDTNTGASTPGERVESHTERAIKTDPQLSQAQCEALLGVYRTFIAEE